jgi:hypothetical protein
MIVIVSVAGGKSLGTARECCIGGRGQYELDVAIVDAERA